jgi:hypothetical protein
MSRRRSPLAALALIAIVAVVSACGSSAPAGTASGSAGTGTGTASSSTGAGAGSVANGAGTNHAKAVKFAACMRSNGVSAFPDPPASGELTIDAIANGSSLDTNSTAFKQAISACKELEPPGFTGQKATPRQMDARLRFAQCMRENGVRDFPDPAPNGPLIDTNRIPSLAGKDPRTDPILNAAMRSCSNFARAAGVTGP